MRCGQLGMRSTGRRGKYWWLARCPNLFLDLAGCVAFQDVFRLAAGNAIGSSRGPRFSVAQRRTKRRAEFPDARIIMLTTFDGDVEVQRALEAGARGHFLKNLPPDELIKAIRDVHAGKKRIRRELAARMAEHMGEDHVSAREIQVLECVAAGRHNREIGERLFISEETVKVHLKRIMSKLGARDRTHAVTIANRRGVVRF
jgi:DNA-binding NarL/FixJ family response regulator